MMKGKSAHRGMGSARTVVRSGARAGQDEALLHKVARSHNLSDDEFAHIVKVLGREPTLTEVGIFGVMYSEHCSYCSSKPYLKTLPTSGARILVPAGKENAGVVDLGDGLAVAFKCESHNHPSAVEPVQGAATGVGGIIRDIFTMGARPIALLDSLRFGPLSEARTRFLFQGVVKGISDYGNAVGVPTVGGEIYFDAGYRENPLVNVMCIGLVDPKQLARAAAKGVGNPVLYVGSSTGRDGLGGASFASRELAEGDADRPAVQIGDPFTEKCLIEATLEALATGEVAGIQDMGAAGLTCSTAEMPAKAGTGMEIEISLVPRREEGMTPYEVMLSESQERMLLVVKKGKQAQIQQIFAKWGLNAVAIGTVTDTQRLCVKDQGIVVADIPVKALTDDAPVYQRPVKEPAYLAKVKTWSPKSLSVPSDYNAALLKLLGSPTIANKAFVYEQYDHMVQTNTTLLPGRGDAALLRLNKPDKYLAATIDGNGRYCYLDPYEGGKAVVAEAARNLVCVGAQPLAVTDCLNFGSPKDPEIMWQFKECVRGLAEACQAFDTPVTGGNVSLYNESGGQAIDPTPIVGMVGLLEGKPLSAAFQQDGDAVILLGETREELGGSEYLSVIHGQRAGLPPRVDLRAEKALQQFMLDAHRSGWLQSAHDCSEGGLAVTLAECCIMDERQRHGVAIELSDEAVRMARRADALLFGESTGRIVVSCRPEQVDRVMMFAKRRGVPASRIGWVGGSQLTIGTWLSTSVEALNTQWRSGLQQALTTPRAHGRAR
jgi:phosphoribosylformylglycinamidine synthase